MSGTSPSTQTDIPWQFILLTLDLVTKSPPTKYLTYMWRSQPQFGMELKWNLAERIRMFSLVGILGVALDIV